MEKEFVLPHGVKIVDGVLHFGDRQVMYNRNKPYRVYDVNSICTCFAIRHTSNSRLCTTLDIILAPHDVDDWRYERGFVWLCGVEIIGGKHLPSAFYGSWDKVEYVLNNLIPELIDSDWSIYVDNDDYVWDDDTNTVRRQKKIETVSYEWND